MKPRYLFWDIDGTLLTTARAGIFAWEEAALEVLGRELDFGALRTAGLTDHEIALLIVESHGVDGDTRDTAARLMRRYAELLPDRLHLRDGHVMPNVRENLEALSGRDDVVNMLLTGNVEPGAHAKLRHYRLDSFFGAGGAFCVEGSDRPSIAVRARELAAAHGDDIPTGDRMVVIGDTPHDVSCGKVIGARTVAVATGGGYEVAELRATGADIVVEQLPPPRDFASLIGFAAPAQ